MIHKKRKHPKEKAKLHSRNRNRERYDFKKLIECCPELASFVKLNIYNDESIDFADPKAVKELNKALLQYHYGIIKWDIPDGYLCPPIPGRADYIHYMADLLCSSNYGTMPKCSKIKCLDIGVGANCIYPIIGVKEYGWSFIGSDIDTVSIESANKIIDSNTSLKEKVELRFQNNPKDFFYGVIKKDEIIDLTVCNPPFHSSVEEARSQSLRKLKNINQKKVSEPILNFGGKNNELIYKGGEIRFVGSMIRESKKYSYSCFWFSSLVAKQTHLKGFYEILNQFEAVDVKTIPMGQGCQIIHMTS